MSKIALYWIDPASPVDNFPPVKNALSQPDGLLCFGGDLSPERLLYAYKRGIFPWYSEGQPIMWWSPSPRCVFYPHELVIRRSLKKTIRNAGYHFSMDRAFRDVIRACAVPRVNEDSTWITQDMQDAYVRLHQLGHAHSAEIWKDDCLVGGLYGIAIGRVFFWRVHVLYQTGYFKDRTCLYDTASATTWISSDRYTGHLFSLIIARCTRD